MLKMKKATSTSHRVILYCNIAALVIILPILTVAAHVPIAKNYECESNGCCDQHEFCNMWASLGQCESNAAWMGPNCQLACDTCYGGTNAKRTKTKGQTKDQQPKPVAVNGTNTSSATPKPTFTTTVGIPEDDDTMVILEPITMTTQTPPKHSNASSSSPRPPAIGKRINPHIAKGLRPPEVMLHGGPKMHLIDDPNKCVEVSRTNPPNSPNILFLLNRDGLISTNEDISNKFIMSREDIQIANKERGCVPRQASADCIRNMCYNLRYRTLDGTCNNLVNSFWGAAQTPYLNLRPQAYDDGAGEPRGWIRKDLPSPRDVTTQLLSSNVLVPHFRYNTLVMQFGQLLVHDVLKTSLLPFDQCEGCKVVPGVCSPMEINPSDPRFGCPFQPCCLPFTRSSSLCQMSPRSQVNENTAFVDASMIYGSSIPDSFKLRANAYLKASIVNGHFFLPFDPNQCVDNVDCVPLFGAGDNRTALFAGLAAVHTLFIHEHNRVGEILQQLNPHWDSDRVFQEARKVVGAEMQVITYKEWLPRVIGREYQYRVGSYNGYDERTDPSIAADFALAAMRFGHGMLQENYVRLDESGKPLEKFGELALGEGVLKPQRIIFEGGIEPLLRGMMAIPAKLPQRITPTMTENLFQSADLAAQNIQRARDAGLPGYNTWREFCGMYPVSSSDDLKSLIPDDNIRNRISTLYRSAGDIDLYAAVILEEPVPNGLVGPTAACLIGEQFKRLRDGDRFWYQNPGVFAQDQINELERASLARFLCDNTDTFRNMPKEGFDMPTENGDNNPTPCNWLPSVDLSRWKENPPT